MIRTFNEWAEDFQEQMPPQTSPQLSINPQNAAQLVQGTRDMARDAGMKGRMATGTLLNVMNTLAQSGPEGLQKAKKVIATMMQAINGLQDLDQNVKDSLMDGIRQMTQGIKAMSQVNPQQGNAVNPQPMQTQPQAGLATQGQPQAM